MAEHLADKVKYQAHPVTALEALINFESGQPVHVIDLGGMGPGYEQAIWNAIFMMIKDRDKDGIAHWTDKEGDNTIWARKGKHGRVCDEDGQRVWKGLHLSGAQADQAITTVMQVLTYGWRTMMEKVPEGRSIMVSIDFPNYRKDAADGGK